MEIQKNNLCLNDLHLHLWIESGGNLYRIQVEDNKVARFTYNLFLNQQYISRSTNHYSTLKGHIIEAIKEWNW